MVTSIVNTKDTSTVYFRPFFQDSSNLCTYKPYDLLGVMVIRDTIVIPKYGHFIYTDSRSESANIADMNKHDKSLKDSIVQNKDRINAWLYKEASRRQVLR